MRLRQDAAPPVPSQTGLTATCPTSSVTIRLCLTPPPWEASFLQLGQEPAARDLHSACGKSAGAPTRNGACERSLALRLASPVAVVISIAADEQRKVIILRGQEAPRHRGRRLSRRNVR